MTKADNPPSQPSDLPILVSVIIPAYNAGICIGRALDSVFAQTFSGFEVIVVNDGSPDTELLERALQPYMARIRYLKQPNKGPGGARNAGILQMRGKYAAFLDADDVWLPGHLASQVAMLRADPSLDLVYADSILTKDGRTVGHAFGSEPQSSPVTFEFILTENCNVGTSSTVASRSALIAAGLFDERFICCEDFDLWLRMSFRGAKMNYDPAVHLDHALSSESLSGNRYVMKRARIEVYEKTASTLPVSEQQRNLIRSLIEKTEAACQVDLLKEFLHSRQYGRALETAERANTVRNNWKLRFTILGLRKAPAIVRYYHHVHERILSLRNRIRRANSLHKVKNMQPHIAVE
jgi:glycosyltransferase involved in cell wall biosynthesis